MSVEFSRHARLRMEERRVPPHEVTIVLAEPDEVTYGEDGELIAAKLLGTRTVVVVFSDSGDIRRIITVMIA